MAASALPTHPHFELPRSARGPAAPHETTLLELVRAVSEVTPDDREVVATVLHLLGSGRVVLCGNFRGERLRD
jgi:hypothetical protein